MNLKTILLASTFFLTPIFATAQKYPLGKDGRTTKQGIERYISDNDSIVNVEFDKKFNVNSNYNDCKVDSLPAYNEYSREKGIYRGVDGAGEIIIDNSCSFENYSVNMLTTEKKNSFIYNGDFVRGVMFHEKAHGFWKLVEKKCLRNGIKLYIQSKNEEDYSFRKSFLQEGVAEYCALKAGEIIAPDNYILPKNLEDSIFYENWEAKYKYSMYFVKDFLDLVGLEFGVEVFLTNAPPTIDEMLNPKSFYKRLKHRELKLGFFKPQDFKTK